VVLLAIALQAQPARLGRDVLIRGIVFSYEAVRDWEAKLTPTLAEALRLRRRGKVGGPWYVDQTYVKVQARRPG
jgi:putative transposase